MADLNSNIFHGFKGLTKFSAANVLLFEGWYEKICTAASNTLPDIFEFTEGRTRSTTASAGERAAAALV